MDSPSKSLLSGKVRDREEMASPGEHDKSKRKNEDVDDSDLPTVLKRFVKEQRQVNARRDKEHQELVETIGGLKESVVNMDVAIRTERDTRQKEITENNTRLDKIGNAQHTYTSKSKPENDEDGNWRDFQVICGGFDEDTDSHIIEDTINDVLKKKKILHTRFKRCSPSRS